MPLRRPKGSKIVIPIDTNLINVFIEIDKIVKKDPELLEKDPLLIPTFIFNNISVLPEDEEIKIKKNKLICYALYKMFTEKKAIAFISPTVLNELRNITYEDEKKLFIDFVEKYAVMPAIDEIDGKYVLSGQEEAEELAQLYCEPYDFTITRDGKEVTQHSYYGPMEYTANQDIFGFSTSPRKPSSDAYVMAWASIFLMSLITLNEKHFIYVKPTDTFRRKGIKTLNVNYLECEEFSAPIPYSPADLFYMFRRQQRVRAGLTFDKDSLNDFSPININEFIPFLLSKFPKIDISFFDSVTKVIETANLEDIRKKTETVDLVTDDDIAETLTDDLDDTHNFDESF